MRRTSFKGVVLVLCLALCFFLVSATGCEWEPTDGTFPSGCRETDSETDSNTGTETDTSKDTDDEADSEAAHGKELNYEAVFSEDVKHIVITIEPDTWQAMLDDMTEKFGEFGKMPAFPGGPPSGDPEDGIFPPSEGSMPPEGARPGFTDENPIWAECTVRFKNIRWDHVGIRFKGQSTLMFAWMQGVLKMPFRLDFDQYEDEYPEIKNQRFYGFKKLALSNNWSDNSMIREKVAGDIFREAGVPMARSTFCRVYLDHGDGPQYFGMYTLIEIPAKPILKTQFDDDDGNLYKPRGGMSRSEIISGATFAEGTFGEEFFEKETNEKKEDWSDIEAVFKALHSQDRSEKPSVWRKNLEEVFNVDGFLKYLAINTVIQNWDTYGNMAQNYFLYGEPKEEDGHLVHWMPWDNNMALMDFELMGSKPLSLYLNEEEVSDQWPLIRFLIDDPVYNSTYVSFVNETINGVFALERTKARFKAAHDLIAEYVVGENGEQPGHTFLTDPGAFETEFSIMDEFVEGRHEAVEEFLDHMLVE